MNMTKSATASLVPNVIQKTHNGERAYDIFSRMLNDRIIFLNEEITDATAATITAQLLYLESENPDEPVMMYINSPGGSVSAGLAIYDVMNYIKCDVMTICTGMAASMAAFLLSSGTKGMRVCLPNSEVMIHQPLGGAQGQATDIDIACRHILRTKERLNTILAANTGKDIAEITRDTERDNYLTAEEALEYGLVDEVKTHRD